MTNESMDIDETACERVMERYGLKSRQAAVNFALELAAAKPMPMDEVRVSCGTGWEGDLDAMRENRIEHL